MKKSNLTTRAAALLISLVLLMAQMVLPAAALAVTAAEMPGVTLTFDSASGSQSVYAQCTDYDGMPVYWATLPADADLGTVTAYVDGSAYGGQPVSADVAASFTDGCTYLEVYDGENYMGTYALYISYAEMPDVQPSVEPEPVPAEAKVKIRYKDGNGEVIAKASQVCSEGSTEIYPDASLVPGYDLDSYNPVTVTVAHDGSYSPEPVVFTVTVQYVAAEAKVKIRYKDGNGDVIAKASQVCSEGSTEIYPDASLVPGYDLDSYNPVTVTVAHDGSYSPEPVVFTVTAQYVAPAEAQVTVQYIDSATGTVLNGYTQTCTEGSTEITPDASYVPGYDLNSTAPVTVTVDSNGNAVPNPVVFSATEQYVAAEAKVKIRYKDSNGEVIAKASQVCGEGSTEIYPDASLVPGYDLDSYDPVTVTVAHDGSYSPEPVVFTVTAQYVAAEAKVEIHYKNSNGEVIAKASQVCGEGSTEIYPDASLVPGYDLDSYNPVTVTVAHDGSYSPEPVVFTVTAQYVAPAEAQVTVQYIDSATGTVLNGYTQTCTEGNTEITPDASYVPGYDLDNTAPVTVSVDSNGNASPNPVVFTVTAQYVAPGEAQVTVQYIDSATGTVLNGYVQTCMEGNTEITPDASYVPGYDLDNTAPITVSVDSNGNASPSSVVFSATEQKAVPTEVKVKIRYKDSTTGDVIAKTNQTCTEGSTEIYPDASLVPGYDLVSTDPVTVTVDHDGNCSTNPVVFKVTAQTTAPMEAQVTVQYIDSNTGTVLYSTTAICKEGSTEITPDASAVPNYDLESTAAVTVTVDNNGAASPDPVNFSVKARELPEPEGYTVVSEVNSYADTNTKGVNFRKTPSAKAGKAFSKIKKGTRVWVYSLVQAEGDKDQYYMIRYNDTDCFVLSSLLDLVTLQGSVPVTYVNAADGAVLNSETITADPGTITVTPDASKVPGYKLLSEEGVVVTISADGMADPASVSFAAEPLPPVEVQIPVSYVNRADNTVLYSTTVTCTEGDTEIAPDASLIPGYDLDSADAVTVNVDEDGFATPAAVTFYAAVHYVPPVEVQVPVSYVSTIDGSVVYTETITLKEGTNTVTPDANNVPGYTLVSADPVSVTVSADGTASPASVIFQVSAPVDGVITLKFVDENGAALMADQTQSLPGGTYNINELLPDVPEGYELLSAYPNAISVASDGSVQPMSVITVTYRLKPVVAAVVTFEYVSGKKQVADTQQTELEPGEYSVQEYAVYPDGYTLEKVSAETITVSADGKASPTKVTFTYTKNKTTAEVRVKYVNAIGEELPTSPQILNLKPGTWEITPDASFVPEGYAISSSAVAREVVVSKDLQATPSEITFGCYETSVTGTLTVQYFDSTTGAIITSETRSLNPGEYSITPDENVVASKGKYERSDVITNTDVTVSEAGVVTPAVVNFYYQPAEVNIYQGYLKVVNATQMRHSASASGESITTLPVGTLLWTAGQYESGSTVWQSSQTVVGTAYSGWVNNADVVKITSEEAQALVDEYNHSAEPDQVPGYYITILNSVPLRAYSNPYASATFLDINTVVYVYGQEYGSDGYVWHETSYSDSYGYIRDGQIRKMTDAEVNTYINNKLNPTAAPATVAPTYNPNTLSSYGYVSASSVNMRASASASSAKITAVKRYGMALVLKTQEVNGVTWYNINYSGKTGWVNGNYFHQMTLNEFNSFLNSNEYKEGIANNSSTGSTGGTSVAGSTGTASQGQVSTVEEWNVETWQGQTGQTNTVTYAPFNPYATPAPTATVDPNATQDPNATADPEAQPTVFAIGTMVPANYGGGTGGNLSGEIIPGTMIPVNYGEETEEGSTGLSLGWVFGIAGVVVIGAAGGVYAYTVSANKKRRAAAAKAAAARRTPTASGASGNASAATQPTVSTAARSPYAGASAGASAAAGYNSQSAVQNNYSAPTGSANPYSSQSGYSNPAGSANPYSSQSGYSAPTGSANPYSSQSSYSDPSGSANPYSSQSSYSASAGSNPYANPNSNPASRPASTANPYASAGSSAGTQQNSYFSDTDSASPYGNPSANSGEQNPYARPSANGTRSRSRMQRREDDQNL